MFQLPDVSSNIGDHKHVMLLSNLPHNLEYDDKTSFGFRVYAKAKDEYNWDVYFETFESLENEKEVSLR